jgi:hypothetical protein
MLKLHKLTIKNNNLVQDNNVMRLEFEDWEIYLQSFIVCCPRIKIESLVENTVQKTK